MRRDAGCSKLRDGPTYDSQRLGSPQNMDADLRMNG